MLNVQRNWLAIVSIALLLLSSCTSPETLGKLDGAVKAKHIRTHLQTLAADNMEGRAPGTPGGQRAADYIAQQFRAAGLLPAVGDSSYFQNVTLRGVTHAPTLAIRGAGRTWRLAPGTEFVGVTQIDTNETAIRNVEVVFAGYGIDAPEYQRNDYAAIDVKGKVLLLLPNEPSTNPALFDGAALTYYGRWSYKYEEAARKGAAGVILIHTAPLAGYGWSVIQNSRAKEQFYINKTNGDLCAFEGWITQEVATEVLAALGQNLDEMIDQANSPDFKATVLPLRASTTVSNATRTLESPNVIARLEGSDPTLKSECILYTSHYDHLGLNPLMPDDNIYNGAFDNASGTATLIEVAREMVQLPTQPKRTILFAAVTAEESGLLGSKFYAQHPVFPLAKTAANLNIDGVNVWGRTHDVVAHGAQRSTLRNAVEKVAQEMGMAVGADPMPEQGLFFRSDQFSLAKAGVPAVFVTGGMSFVGQPETWGQQMMAEYIGVRYHNVRDEYDPNWSLEGASQIGRFVLKLGLDLANAPEMPQWNDGDQFKRVRDQHLNEVALK
jgi:Zn-dependent M28 family amino/carboxypeptidase